jgi:hypothetical protein
VSRQLNYLQPCYFFLFDIGAASGVPYFVIFAPTLYFVNNSFLVSENIFDAPVADSAIMRQR